MCKRIRKMMFGYKIKAVCKGCINYALKNAQDDVLVKIIASSFAGCTKP